MFRYLLETGGKEDEEDEASEEGKLDRNCNETQAPSSSSPVEESEPLLSGYEVMVMFPSLTVNDLLARVGARRVLTFDSFSFARDITRIIIVDSAHCYGTEASRRLLRKERLAVVDKDWLLDSISSHSVRPLKDYTADISDKELAKAGYSSPLVEVD